MWGISGEGASRLGVKYVTLQLIEGYVTTAEGF